MSEATKNRGSCHCGKVRYEVAIDLSQPVFACNCSICERSGTLLSFVPEKDFKLVSGEQDLRDYQFHKHVMHHAFCTTCGIKSFVRGLMPDGSPTVGVNMRCIEGVDLEALKITHYDGKSV